MAKFWYNRIKMGKATIDDVPDKWKEEVIDMLERGE